MSTTMSGANIPTFAKNQTYFYIHFFDLMKVIVPIFENFKTNQVTLNLK